MIILAFLAVLLIPVAVVAGILALVFPRRRRAVLRGSALAYGLLVPALLFGVGPWLAARALTQAGTRPMDRALTGSPSDYGVPYENIEFHAADSVRLSGWFVEPSGNKPVLVCTHGLFRNRVELLARVMPLCRQGYGALLYDSRAHGASGKAAISLGYHEKNDVLGAVRYVERRYPDPLLRPGVVLFGVSMGAVATLQAAAQSNSYEGLILDSPFSSLERTIADHSWLFLRLPRFPFVDLFLFWFERMASIGGGFLTSEAAIARVQLVPLLLISSEGDARIPASVAQSLYDAAVSPRKKLKIFGKDVPHGAASRLHPEEYTRLLAEFLANPGT